MGKIVYVEVIRMEKSFGDDGERLSGSLGSSPGTEKSWRSGSQNSKKEKISLDWTRYTIGGFVSQGVAVRVTRGIGYSSRIASGQIITEKVTGTSKK
jgi:hypothetical protein